ncbi:Ribonuclease H-like domain-containing protein [Cynara cardunculus var. scolymus]|uniref:Ribonuclease H-like domain-containing protein n=1 Tax=Cynara cardunculus var. scolymus TaxID=59895 RepID=A0A103XSH7_CYNCS|nr:Ribonuclease H-like domain-containing protein [Cynara cardunculus var. scolymus]
MAQRQGIPDVKECKSITLFKALMWIRDMGQENLVFETDSQTVVSTLTHKEEDCMEFWDIIHACKMVLNATLSFKVNFIRRNRNEVAHKLARRSQFFVEPISRAGSPEWLIEDLLSFCNVLDR